MQVKLNKHGRYIECSEKLSVLRYILSTEYNATFKLICWAIIDAYNTKTRQCNPSASNIASRINTSTSTVKKYLKSIQKSGFITLICRGNKGRSNIYEINRNLIDLGNKLSNGTNKVNVMVPNQEPTGSDIRTPGVPNSELEYMKEYMNKYENKTDEYIDGETFQKIVMSKIRS